MRSLYGRVWDVLLTIENFESFELAILVNTADYSATLTFRSDRLTMGSYPPGGLFRTTKSTFLHLFRLTAQIKFMHIYFQVVKIHNYHFLPVS